MMADVIDLLHLVLCKGLGTEGRRLAREWLAVQPQASVRPLLTDPAARLALEQHLRRTGVPLRATLAWPPEPAVPALIEQLERAGVALAWHGDADYPERLVRDLTDSAPLWLWLAGDRARLGGRTCAVIGSRFTPPLLLDAARRLGQALAEAGICVVSGLATGADTAAHEGAMLGRAGSVGVPAKGLLRTGLAFSRVGTRPGPMTYVGLDLPDAPFSAGLAIRRNSVLAALGEGLVLVASDLRGGSSYGVQWALTHGRPLWCFAAGAQTPPANRHLLHQQLARPLDLADSPAAWAEQIRAGLEDWQKKPLAACNAPENIQLDWLAGA